MVLVNTVAEMAAVTPYTFLKSFNVLGQFTPGDGAGGRWIFSPTSEAVADGYYVVATPTTGRYIRMF